VPEQRPAGGGLHGLAAKAGAAGPPRLLDHWILGRATAAAQAAAADYRHLRLAAAGRRLVALVEDLRRYGRLAARLVAEPGSPPAVAASLGGVIASLETGFSPICPFVVSKLASWAREAGLGSVAEQPSMAWVDPLVQELARHRAVARRLATGDDSLSAYLQASRGELEELSGAQLEVADHLEGRHLEFGPCRLSAVAEAGP
jgi:hypothetical protein